MLSEHGFDSLKGKKILEIGCGSGHWLRAFLQWGAVPENLFGIDLLPGRIEEARRTCPPGVHLECGNAASLGFADGSFDLVLQSTVFTSILDSGMKQRIAAEMLRLLKAKGFVLWYDFHVNNPRNPEVRGIRKSEIKELFPRCRIHLRRTTLAPPIARLVGPSSALLYIMLSRTKILCTHYLGLIERD
jgi:ubiquinone/menaquinone biosynthesis C-methylase UbiE